MKLTDFTKSVLAGRREARRLEKQGYERVTAGFLLDMDRLATTEITDVVLGENRRTIWAKTTRKGAKS
jgi:hypothetical protein